MRRKREFLSAVLIIFIGLFTIMGGILSNAIVLPPIIKSSALPLLVVVTVLLLCFSIWHYQHQKSREEIVHTLERQNRKRMLFKVRTVLEQSFPRAPLIALRLREQQDAITNPQQHVSGLTEQLTQELPSCTQIKQAYTEAGGELLILGEPGSGKTMLLLELTRDLLESAERDDREPIPVVFNLSSWEVKQRPLTDWLIEELNTKYQVPRSLGQSWVDHSQLVLVLDGLDEITRNVRPACVNAINVYRQDHGLVSMVICSRSNEYLDQVNRVSLHKVVIVQSLTLEQIDAYLGNFGESGEAIRVMLYSNPQLQDLVTSPLMLSVLIRTYSDQSRKALPETGLPTTQQQILAGYVERMLQRRETTTRYTQQQIMHWLMWLANQLRLHSQTEFYLERIQPDWLPEGWLRSFYYALVCSIVGFVFGLFFWFIAWLIFGLTVGLAVGLFGALVSGLGVTFIIKRGIQPVEILSWTWVSMRQKLPLVLSAGLVGGLVGGLGAVQYGDQYGLPGELLFGLVGALISGLLSGVSRTTLDERKPITPNEGIRRSARYSGLVWLLGALSIWLGGGLVSKLGGVPFGGSDLGDGLLRVLVGGLIIGLVGALYVGGLTCIQHVILRLLLWLAGSTPCPWSFLRFLDYATTCILLRKVGGGYIFIHSLLLDYLGEAKIQSTDFRLSRRTFVISLLGSLTLGGVVGGIIGNRIASRTSAQILLPKAWWYPTSNMLLARGSFHATRLQDGMILVQGGTTATGPTAESELFDLTRDIWTTTKGGLNEKRSQHTATLLPNGKVLITGGYAGSKGLASAELYDPTTDMWTLTKQRMRQARTRHTATLLPNEKVLIVGGVEGLPVGGQPLASAELYDLATDTWSLASEMHSQRADHVAVLMSNGKVLVAGGTLVNDGQTITATVEFYDPSSNTWTFVEDMHMPRAYFTAVPLPSEKVLVIGGRLKNFNSTPTAEIYDYNTRSWSTTNDMQYARQNTLGQIALTLEDGSILVAGGDDLGTSEVYSPRARTWTSLLSLGFSHRDGATVLLGEGRALVVGGTDARGKISSISSSAEIYAPS